MGFIIFGTTSQFRRIYAQTIRKVCCCCCASRTKKNHQAHGGVEDVERRQTIGSGGGGSIQRHDVDVDGSLTGRRYPTYHCRVESDGARLEVAASGRIVAVRGPPELAKGSEPAKGSVKGSVKAVGALNKKEDTVVPAKPPQSQQDKDLIIARAQEVLARKSSVRLAQPWRTLGIDRQVERERGWGIDEGFVKETD